MEAMRAIPMPRRETKGVVSLCAEVLDGAIRDNNTFIYSMIVFGSEHKEAGGKGTGCVCTTNAPRGAWHCPTLRLSLLGNFWRFHSSRT